MKIIKKKITEIISPDYNPRIISEYELNKLKQSISNFGYVEPIIVNQRNNHVIGGNQRLKVLKQLGYDEVDVVLVDLDDNQEKSLNIALNKISGDWDNLKLSELLDSLKKEDENLFNLTGFDLREFSQVLGEAKREKFVEYKKINGIRKLEDDYIEPPFSVLRTFIERWQKRKKLWYQIIPEPEKTREDKLYNSVLLNNLPSVSLFDPVLSEILYLWFCPKNGKILNLFSGDIESNIVAGIKKYNITGIELRKEQVDYINEISKKLNIYQYVNILQEDVKNVDKLVPDNHFDFLFSCPPYYNLEKYSDLEEDLSNKSIEDFDITYKELIRKSVKKLKNERFACFVVGEVRSKKEPHNYLGLIPKTIKFFEDAGLKYYNEIILYTAIGTVGLRCRNYWEKSRKVGKTHQNALIFYKGDNPKEWTNKFATKRDGFEDIL